MKNISTHANADIGTYTVILNSANFVGLTALGEGSDAFGRRPQLLLSIVGAAGTTALIATLGASNAVKIPFLAGTAAICLVGGQFGANTGMFAVLADLTSMMTLDKRTAVFGRSKYPLATKNLLENC